MRELNQDEKVFYEDCKGRLERYADTIGQLPYSHNLISLTLREVAKKLGYEFANRLIDELELEDLGYSKSAEGDGG